MKILSKFSKLGKQQTFIITILVIIFAGITLIANFDTIFNRFAKDDTNELKELHDRVTKERDLIITEMNKERDFRDEQIRYAHKRIDQLQDENRTEHQKILDELKSIKNITISIIKYSSNANDILKDIQLNNIVANETSKN